MPLPPQRDDAAPDWAKLATPILVAVLSFAAFLPALNAKLVDWDDQVLLIENTRYQGLTIDNIRWMFSSAILGHYQPLTWVSYAIDWYIWGDPTKDAFGYHWTSIALHTLNSLLVFGLALRLIPLARGNPHLRPDEPDLRLRFGAAAAALLFAVHPLRVESVAWVTERRDVLSGFFLLLTIWAYLNAVSPGRAQLRSRAWYAASLALLLLSLLAKAWGMTFFAVALVLDWWPLRRLPLDLRAWPRRDHWPVFVQKVPYALLGVASGAAAAIAQLGNPERLGAMRTMEQWGLTERVVQVCYGLVWYVRKTLWPTDLATLYALPPMIDPFEPQYLVCYAVVLLAGLLLVIFHRRIPALTAATACYVVVVSPVLGITQSGEQFVADRYSYLSCLSWAFLAGGVLYWILTAARTATARTAAVLTTATAVLVMLPLTWRQTETWQDSTTLWAHAVRTAPSAQTHLYYGSDLEARGDLRGAIEHYRTAVLADPGNGRAWFVLANAIEDAGELALRAGDSAAAMEMFKEAEAGFLKAAGSMERAYQAYTNLGRLYLRHLGRDDEGIRMYKEAVAIAEASPPEDFSPLPYLALGDALHRTGDIAGARAAFEKAARHPETQDRAMAHLGRLPPQ